MKTGPLVLFVLAAACWPADGLADEIWLLGDEKPHTGEVMEETPHAFIVKFPKSQVQQIKRDKPLEIRQWQERRILWQDTGDNIVLTLPKERVESSDTGQGEKARHLSEALGSVGTQKSDSAGKATGFTGRVVGKVISHGEPVASCKVMLVSRGGEAGVISKLFGGKKSSANAPPSSQAVTDREGKYALEDVVVGEYNVYWQPPNEKQWTRKLSEKPDVTVTTGETVQYPDIYVP
ncbi:MAG: carboxypeptidase-like regulatory domain-containing protein [Verrucomicrobiota bacterium]